MKITDTVLVVIDVQGKLATLVHEHELLFGNIERMIKIAQALNVSILWTEQAPDKIGETIEPIRKLLFPVIKPIHKRSFSCFACPEFRQKLALSSCRQIILTGIESHVCVYQTARDLKRFGYDVFLPADGVSSRTKANKDIAIERMRFEEITITSAEMIATELLASADHLKFKEVMANIKR